jgi:drug/metabolite transporter (DMT)-like permease
LAVGVQNYWPNNPQIVGIFPICIGVMLAVYEEAHNETLGIVLCMIATVANALRTALSSFLLQVRAQRRAGFAVFCQECDCVVACAVCAGMQGPSAGAPKR